MIRVVVVDDHPIVREGLVAAIEDEDDFAVVGAASSAEEALPLVERSKPDVVILDLELPGLDGVEALTLLTRANPDTQTLVFTAYDTEERVLGAIRAGARGYLLKGASLAEIAHAIRTVAKGETVLTPRVAERVVAAMQAPRGAGALTVREREVLGLIADGLPSKQIARALGISERTVKFHIASLLRKLDADNRAEAVAHAAERGLLSASTTRRPPSPADS